LSFWDLKIQQKVLNSNFEEMSFMYDLLHKHYDQGRTHLNYITLVYYSDIMIHLLILINIGGLIHMLTPYQLWRIQFCLQLEKPMTNHGIWNNTDLLVTEFEIETTTSFESRIFIMKMIIFSRGKYVNIWAFWKINRNLNRL